MNILDSKGGRNSVYPCTEGLTFHPFIYMVPQFKPIDVLMLGYAGGSVAGLIRLFYGAVPITAVDSIEYEDYGYNVSFIKKDAREYIKNCREFEVIIVDLYEDGENIPCDFVTLPDFIKDLRSKGGYLIIHAKENTDMSNYGKPVKVLVLNDSRFYYYTIYQINKLPIACVLEK